MTIIDSTGLSLAEIAALAGSGAALPVDRWQPEHCGHSRMRIGADGRWFHEGNPIHRPELVKLFSSILRREADGSYVVVTPGEKLDIDVDDLPFVAVEVTAGAGTLAFRLNTGDYVMAGPEHPLTLGENADRPRPSILVRAGLDARIARPVFYELAALALAADPPGLTSAGVFFPFGS